MGADMKTAEKNSSVAEMKPSQKLRKALSKFDGGKRWVPRCGNGVDTFCALNAMGCSLYSGFLAKAVTGDSENDTGVANWNDSAADFSVIEQGFQKAIALAESEGK